MLLVCETRTYDDLQWKRWRDVMMTSWYTRHHYHHSQHQQSAAQAVSDSAAVLLLVVVWFWVCRKSCMLRASTNFRVRPSALMPISRPDWVRPRWAGRRRARRRLKPHCRTQSAVTPPSTYTSTVLTKTDEIFHLLCTNNRINSSCMFYH